MRVQGSHGYKGHMRVQGAHEDTRGTWGYKGHMRVQGAHEDTRVS